MVEVQVEQFGGTLTELIQSMKEFGHGVIGPNTKAALQASAEMVSEKWKAFLTKSESFPGSDKLKRPMNGMAASIKALPINGSSIKIISASSHAGWMERGEKAIDLKQTHPYGPKSRVSKKNVPYLIIPFRQGSPGSIRSPMPQGLYNDIRAMVKSDKFGSSSVNSSKSTIQNNFAGEAVKRQGYDWGARLKDTKENPIAERFRGMVRFEQNNVKSGKIESQYFTFRIISAKSPADKWIIPEKPAVIPHVIEATKEDIADVLEFGIKKDLGL